MKPQIRLLLLVISCIALGYICGGMQNEAFSYIIGIVGGLGMWYILFGDILK